MKKNLRYQKRKKRHNTKAKHAPREYRCLVFRSNRYMYAQVIHQPTGNIVLMSSDHCLEKKEASGTKITSAQKIGEDLGKKLLDKKITRLVFDRNGYKYHGRVKALCEGLRTQKIDV